MVSILAVPTPHSCALAPQQLRLFHFFCWFNPTPGTGNNLAYAKKVQKNFMRSSYVIK